MKSFAVGWFLCGFIGLGMSVPINPENESLWRGEDGEYEHVLIKATILVAFGPIGTGAQLTKLLDK